MKYGNTKFNEFIKILFLITFLTKEKFMLPPSVITGAVVGGLYGALNASSTGITYPSEIAGWATPYMLLGALLGFILHIIFFRNK